MAWGWLTAVAHQGENWRNAGFDGRCKENVLVCIKSYIGEKSSGKHGGADATKLKQQVLSTCNGCVPLPNDAWQGGWLR